MLIQKQQLIIFAKKLRNHFELFKNEAVLNAILNKEDLSLQNFKENLKANLYKITMLTLKEKSQLKDLIQKEKLSKEDREILISLLNKLKNEELSGLFEDIGIKKKLISSFIKLTNRNSFSTFEFLKQLKIKVESIVGYSIRQDVFSKEYLGRSRGHYEYIISKSKSTLDYKILKPILLHYEKHLKIKLGSKFEKAVTLFEKYRNSNLLSTKKYRIFKFHPNLNINYFQIINTVEKAYWFGFLLADGSILIQKGNRALSIELNVNDGILLKNFTRVIGFNPLYVKYYKRIYHNNKGERKIKRTFRVKFTNDDFVNNMINNGFILGDKADKITFPSFTDPEFQLACLLGFFDGDGSHVGTPTIYSKSCDFLESVVKVLKIRGYNKTFEVKPKRKSGKTEGYYLGLGQKYLMIC